MTWTLLGADNIPTWTDQSWAVIQGAGPAFHWREQSHLFSFNPCLYHSSVATVGGTEREVTDRLLADGRSFAFWGAQGDAPRVRHVGVSGGMGSPGWRA